MAIIDAPDFTVEYADDAATKEAVFNAVIEFFKKHGTFSGESLCQNDRPIADAPNFLSDLADDLIGFKLTWKD